MPKPPGHVVLPVLKTATAETALVISVLHTPQGLVNLNSQKNIFDPSVRLYQLPSEAFVFELAAWVLPTEGDLSSETKIQYSRLQRRAVWMSIPHVTAPSSVNALHTPITEHTSTLHDPFESGHNIAVAAGFKSPEAT